MAGGGFRASIFVYVNGVSSDGVEYPMLLVNGRSMVPSAVPWDATGGWSDVFVSRGGVLVWLCGNYGWVAALGFLLYTSFFVGTCMNVDQNFPTIVAGRYALLWGLPTLTISRTIGDAPGDVLRVIYIVIYGNGTIAGAIVTILGNVIGATNFARGQGDTMARDRRLYGAT